MEIYFWDHFIYVYWIHYYISRKVLPSYWRVGIPNIGGGEKYLDLFEQFGWKKKNMSIYVKENVQKKVNGW